MHSNYFLDILLLPVLITICFIVVYEDFKEGKIKNKWIKWGLLWGAGVYFSFFLFSLLHYFFPKFFSFNLYFLSFSYLVKVLVNTLIASVLSFSFWYFKFWSAGDAKLFILVSFLFPLKYYWRSYLHWFPSFSLLINIFLPAFVFSLLSIFWEIFKRLTLGLLKKNLTVEMINLLFNYKEFLHRKIPFAFWVLVGIVFTLYLKGSIIPLLIKNVFFLKV